MSPTQDYQHGRFADALGWWGAQLAAGRSWRDIEAEIVDCCQGRVDSLTRLLIEAETLREGSSAARRGDWSSPGVPAYAGPPGL
jgi:hypothetical protein